MTTSPLLEALNKNDFASATQLFENGEEFPADISEYTLRQIYEHIVRAKAFRLLDALVKKGKIGTDIYEYESFRYSIYEILFKALPADDESLLYLKNFIEHSDNINDEVEGHTLLSYAVEAGAAPAVLQTLIDGGLRPDFKNNAKDNLLNQVLRINMMPKEKQLAYLDVFIRAGVDVNEANVEKKTAIHIAVTTDKRDMLDLLLQHGARPNEQDWVGNTAFFYALAHKLDPRMYNTMAGYERADFLLENREGQTILSEYLRMMPGGEQYSALLERLIDDGAKLEQTAPYYGRPKSGWDWIAEKDPELLQKMLVKTGIDVNWQDDHGDTLLHKVCAIDCNYAQETAKSIYRKVKILLEAGANTSITNSSEQTAEMLASNDNLKAKTAELLIKSKSP